MGADNYSWRMVGRGEEERAQADARERGRLEEENARMRAALEELNENANRILAGDLSWLTRRDIAAAVADRTKAALGERTT